MENVRRFVGFALPPCAHARFTRPPGRKWTCTSLASGAGPSLSFFSVLRASASQPSADALGSPLTARVDEERECGAVKRVLSVLRALCCASC